MRKTKTGPKLTWLSVLLGAGLVVCFSGCASTRGPTAEEFPKIISAVRQRLETERGTLPDTAPVEIVIRKRRAVVTYRAEYDMGQFGFYPMRTELEFQTNAWTVVGHKSNRSWLWHVANHTIGVK